MFICTTKSILYSEYIYNLCCCSNQQQRPTSSEIRRFWLRATRSIFANWYLEKQRYLKLSFGECAPDESNLENYPNSKLQTTQKTKAQHIFRSGPLDLLYHTLASYKCRTRTIPITIHDKHSSGIAPMSSRGHVRVRWNTAIA